MKREVTRYSLWRPYDDQILNAKSLFYWAAEHLHGIKTVFADKKDILKTALKLNSRFKKAKQLVSTQSFHHFVPVVGSTREILVFVLFFFNLCKPKKVWGHPSFDIFGLDQNSKIIYIM